MNLVLNFIVSHYLVHHAFVLRTVDQCNSHGLASKAATFSNSVEVVGEVRYFSLGRHVKVYYQFYIGYFKTSGDEIGGDQEVDCLRTELFNYFFSFFVLHSIAESNIGLKSFFLHKALNGDSEFYCVHKNNALSN